ncbi:BTB/POZ domain-containing protein [Aphelenchoides avenae]|nr:BTB/POZ domain-containing protein [Aphelenchus avenae]
MTSNEPFDFSSPGAKFVNYQHEGSITLTIDNITEFIGDPLSFKLSDKVDVGGVKWFVCAKNLSKNNAGSLACYLNPVADGTVWHRWVKSDIYLRKSTGTKHWHKSRTNRLMVTIVVEFSVGVDIFTQQQEFSDVTFVVEGRRVYAHKGHLAVMSKVLGTMLMKSFEEATKDEIPLKDTKLEDFVLFLAAIYPTNEPVTHDSVKGVYRLAHFYQVAFLVEKCEEHLLLSTRIPIVEKLLLAEKLQRDDFCDRIVDRMSVTDVKALATDQKRHRLSLGLVDQVLQKYIELKP